MKTLRRTLVAVCALLITAYAILLVDWRGSEASRAPVVRRAFEVSGPLSAGSARLRLSPPLPVVRAGYGMPRAEAVSERDPLETRALVLRAGVWTVALVLVDLVFVTQELSRELESRLAASGIDVVVLVATHTHSSVGGFDSRVLAQIVGTGRHRVDVVDAVVDRSEAAVHMAMHELVPVGIRTGETRLGGWAENRSTPGAPIDDMLTAAELSREGGEPWARIGIVSAHPTLLPRTVRELSGDYPGDAMRRLAPRYGAAFLFQGAGGDARPPGSGALAIEADGSFVARRAVDTLATATAAEGRLGWADVEIGLPRAEPQAVRSFFVRRPASNVVEWMAPRTTRVTVLTIGDLMLLGVPGEPTALAAQRILTGIPKDSLGGRRVRVVGLVGDYIGYVDTPERVLGGEGEARRAWFGPELLDVVTRGLAAGVSALRGPS
jgi:Neutral/alkaline non-lysosomal ceramidase, N-terminal